MSCQYYVKEIESTYEVFKIDGICNGLLKVAKSFAWSYFKGREMSFSLRETCQNERPNILLDLLRISPKYVV
jgi:hypothetical protein